VPTPSTCPHFVDDDVLELPSDSIWLRSAMSNSMNLQRAGNISALSRRGAACPRTLWPGCLGPPVRQFERLCAVMRTPSITSPSTRTRGRSPVMMADYRAAADPNHCLLRSGQAAEKPHVDVEWHGHISVGLDFETATGPTQSKSASPRCAPILVQPDSRGLRMPRGRSICRAPRFRPRVARIRESTSDPTPGSPHRPSSR